MLKFFQRLFLFIALSSMLNANYKVEQQVYENQESIDGLLSIVDGYSEKLYSLEQQIIQNSKKQESVLDNLNSSIEKIESDFVTKDELKEIIAKLSKDISKEKVSNKPKSTILKEAINHYNNKQYKKAKDLFEVTDKRNYKRATSNFYLGEIAYYTEEYKTAIKHFKISAKLYSKAKYMSKLLYHTAYSLEKIGDLKQAKKFYTSVISMYGQSKYVSYAKNRLKKLGK